MSNMDLDMDIAAVVQPPGGVLCPRVTQLRRVENSSQVV